ncbi:hypothetical protein S965_001969 [Salmonella enterica subsp. salamae]|nr:hypothetical protein [Salmonella enterica subsp. salamae]
MLRFNIILSCNYHSDAETLLTLRNSVRLVLWAECRKRAVSIDTPVFCIAHDAIETLFSKSCLSQK